MAFTPLTFTKSWENAEDFPTYEPDETQVRADLQYLYDEIRDAFNGLVAALNDTSAASNLPVSVEGLTAGTLQEALEETLAEIQNAAAGQIVNGSITKEKLHAALLQRVYGGRTLVCWDTPGSGDNEAADYPVGQLWLRPALTVENRAGSAWTCSGCTAADRSGGGWTFTADHTMAAASASQRLNGLGQAGQTALVHLTLPGEDASLTALTVYLGGEAVTLPADGWLEAELDSGGGLELQLSAQWPSAQAAGYFQVGDLTVAAVGALEAAFPQCAPPASWTELLDGQLPFTAFTQPRALFLEVADGVWETVDYEVLPVSRGGTGRAAVTAGQLLYGGSGGLEALDPPDTAGSLLRFTGGAPQWSAPEETVAALGVIRTAQGTYSGNAAARTITLSVTPKVLVVLGGGETCCVLLQDQRMGRTIQCSQATSSGGYPNYTAGLELQGNKLTAWMNASSTAIQCGASPRAWNAAGTTYTYLALY